jgi:hypothetical protein
MTQQGQVFELNRRRRDGERLWAYRYRLAGRDSRRVQRGGFACPADALEALEPELERLRRKQWIPRGLTLSEFVETYLAQRTFSRTRSRSCAGCSATPPSLSVTEESVS